MKRIILFNWPKLVAAVGVIAASVIIAATTDGAVRVGLLLLTFVTTYFFVASLAVSWWVYDRSALHSWKWITRLLPAVRTHWALVHAGFDETGPRLLGVLGRPDAVIDLSPQLRRVSPSLRRARRHEPAEATALVESARLPISSSTLDMVMLVFAAHEVRDVTAREALFDELHRVLRPGGRVVLVEHLRDAANVAAFGPGAWHFQTRREWIRLADRSGFSTVGEVSETTFVRAIALCPR